MWLSLCGHTIQLRFGDSRLRIPLSLTFIHLMVEPQETADLTILVSSGDRFSLPELPFPASAFRRRCELATDRESGIEASFMMGPDILSMLDHEHRTAIYWIRDGSAVPAFEQAAPFRHLFHWYLRRHEWMLVHAAAIGRQNGGILICGKGGTGKSTLAAATWHQAEWKFAGDDYCAVSLKPPHVVAPVYPSAKLTAATARMLSLVIPEHPPTDGEKTILFASSSIPGQLAEPLRIIGLVVPFRVSVPSPTTRLLPAEAARHLAISTLYQMPHAGKQDLRNLTRIARDLPAWQLPVPQGRPQDALKALTAILEQDKGAPT